MPQLHVIADVLDEKGINARFADEVEEKHDERTNNQN